MVKKIVSAVTQKPRQSCNNPDFGCYGNSRNDESKTAYNFTNRNVIDLSTLVVLTT